MSNAGRDSLVELSDHQLDTVAAGAPPGPFTVPGAPQVISPGQPAGIGPAQITRMPGDSPDGRPDVVRTPGAPGTVFPGSPSRS
jgi:hypothetical protein